MTIRKISATLCAVAMSLVISASSALAQDVPSIAAPNDADKFDAFCEAFGLREYPFGSFATLWSDRTYQDVRSFIVAQRKQASARLSRLESRESALSGQIMQIEFKELDLVSSMSQSLPCPTGQVRSLCPIGSCEFVSGVLCVQRDVTDLRTKKAQLLDRLVAVLNEGMALAARTKKQKQRAEELSSALTGLKDNHSALRKQFGLAYTCSTTK
jgi:hypothetical protein